MSQERRFVYRIRTVRLRPQLAAILGLLASRPGEVVTREELQRVVWGERVVDFERGLNFCIKDLREELQDDAAAPRFIQTLPKRGYRLIAPVAQAPRDAQVCFRRMRLRTWASQAAAALGLILVAGFLSSDVRNRPSAPVLLRMAVLPFANLSGDATQDFLSDGLTDDVTTQLGQLAPEHLILVAPTSTTQYRGTTQSIARVGRELDVAYVLSGSVRVADRVHVNVRLIRVTDGMQIWADHYERTLRDLYRTQRDIAQGVARSLALKLLPSEPTALARASTPSTAAYEQYLRGLTFLRRGTEADFRQAVAAFERARQEDPQFVVANTGLAAAFFLLHDYGMIPREATCQATRQALEDALSRDTVLPQSHAWHAEFLATCTNDPAGAEREYRRAMQGALALDPRSADAHAAVGYILHRLGRDGAALARARAALAVDPQFPFAMYVIARACAALKRYPEAVAALERAVGASGRGPKYLFTLAVLYARIGRTEQARQLFDELNAMAATRYVPPGYLRRVANAV